MNVIQIPKILKILISILIAISIAVTPFATGFNVKSEAVIPITGNPVGDFILDGVIGGALYWAFQEIAEDIEFVSNSAKEAFYSSCNGYTEHVINAAEDSGYIVCNFDYTAGDLYHNGDYYCYQNPCVFTIRDGVTLSAEEQYFYNTLISELNAAQIKPIYNTLTSSYMVDTNTYENIKSAVVNTAIKEYAEVSKADLGEALGDGAIPTYNFDFVGPMPTLELPTLNKYGAFVQEGYYHSLPVTIDPSQKIGDSFYYIGEAQSSALVNLSTYNGAKLPLARYVNNSLQYGLGAYSCSQYILHDGKIYYACIANDFYDGGCSFYNHLGYICSPDSYIAADGTRLSSTDFDVNSSFQMGYVANIDGVYKGANPAFAAMNESATTAPTERDFTTTTGGAISIPKTIAETVIGNAIEMGLLNPDSVLGINENGEIVSADGIELAKLQEIVGNLETGNLKLEDIQSYLDLISKLVSSGNVTSKAIETALTNVKAVELDKNEFSAITVKHTGLVEAETLVNKALPIVSQTKQLLMNMFNQAESAPDYIPNFSFYWDSNKDGMSEKYTALDLSFMELPLTNTNLADKNRFKSSMTVREFIQSLIIFIVYILCGLKFLRRLPGLFGGSESFGEDLSTVIRHK